MTEGRAEERGRMLVKDAPVIVLTTCEEAGPQ